jgi:hypothetical protein
MQPLFKEHMWGVECSAYKGLVGKIIQVIL